MKKRILSYENHFSFLKANEAFRFIVHISDVPESTIGKIGFPNKLVVGMSILPGSEFGSTSLFNAEGKEIKRKDLPMETALRTVEWHWDEWRGRYDRVQRSKFVDVPYERYQRDFVAPPSEEIEVLPVGDMLVFSSRVMTNTKSREGSILHVANLFLEVFGQFEIVSGGLENYVIPKRVKLNWLILPPGEYPWEKVNTVLQKIVKMLPEGSRHWAQNRIETMRKHDPDFYAVGAGGFYGYVVYGFSRFEIYVMETILYGNATYIFKRNWRSLSQLTKAEVLRSDSDVQRIIHHSKWTEEIDTLLG